MYSLLSATFFATFLRVFIFDLLIAFTVAKLEIQIEGRNGWAQNLPTWKIKNKLTQVVWGDQPYTGYHWWLLCSILVLLHFPFFLAPQLWSPAAQVLVLGHFCLGVILEDFIWFALNPYFGWGKFDHTHAPWHGSWKIGVPVLYLKLGSLSIFLFLFAFLYLG